MRTVKIFTAILIFSFLTIGIQAQTPTQNKATVLKSYEEYSKTRDAQAWFSIMADDYVDYSMGPEPVQGRAAVEEAAKQFVAAFPDVDWKVLRTVAEGNMVWVELEMSGTFKNDFMGMKATGKSFKIRDVNIYEFNNEGKAKAGWGVQDPMVMMSQIMGVK